MRNDARINYVARMLAIEDIGLEEDYKRFAKEHRGVSRHCLANQYCLTRRVCWRRYKEMLRRHGAMDAIDVLSNLSKTIRSLKDGESTVTACPRCGGALHASKSAYNGHLRIECEDCGVLIVQ